MPNENKFRLKQCEQACETMIGEKGVAKTPLANRIYGTDNNANAKTYLVSETPVAESIPQRNAVGQLLTSAVVSTDADNVAVNKKYVDDAVASAGGGTKLYRHTITSAGNFILSLLSTSETEISDRYTLRNQINQQLKCAFLSSPSGYSIISIVGGGSVGPNPSIECLYKDNNDLLLLSYELTAQISFADVVEPL